MRVGKNKPQGFLPGYIIKVYEIVVGGGSYLVIKISPIVTGDILLVAIGYKYKFRKFLRFISTEGAGSTEPGDTYLFCYPDNYPNVSVCTVAFP